MKKTLSIILAVCVVLSLAVITVSAKTYTDVPDTHWAKAPIDKWTTNNVMVGKTDTVFGVNDYMTRGEIAEILNNLLRKSNVSLTVLSKFSDVDASTPYAQAIANCSEYGIFTGNSNGTFRPSDNVTREQLVSTIGRAIDLTSNGNEASKYTDKATISEYALPFINGFTKDGRLVGYPDGSLKPARFISKAETAKLLSNIVDVYVTAPGSYNVTRDQIVFVATEGNVNLTGGQPESVVVSQQSAITVPEGTKVVNKSNGTISVNNNSVTQQTSIIAPAPAATGTTVSGGSSGGGYKPSSYKVTFEISGPVKGGSTATETSSPVTVSTTGKITNTIFTELAKNITKLDATFDGTGFKTIIIDEAQAAYDKGVDSAEWATLVGKFSTVTADDDSFKSALINDATFDTLTVGKTYTLTYNSPATWAGYTTSVYGEYTFTATVSK